MESYLLCDSFVLARRFGVSVDTLRLKARSMGLVKKCGGRAYEWSDAELSYLRAHYPDETLDELRDVLHLSVSTISRKAKELGLEKSESYKRRDFNCRYVKDYVNVCYRKVS